MRAVHINHRYAPYYGGSERYIQEIAEGFAACGHSSNVVATSAFDLEYLWDPKRESVDAPANECFNGVSVDRVSIRHVPMGPFLFKGTRRLMGEFSRISLDPAVFRRTSQFFPWLPSLHETITRTMPADIVHAGNLGLEGLALTARDVAQEWDANLVLTPFIHIGLPGDIAARRFSSMPHQLELLRSAHLILTMTELERSYINRLGVNSETVRTVGAGVDFKDVTGGNADAARDRFAVSGKLVTAIGALAPEKGTIHLVKAVRQLREAGRDAELILAGPEMSGFNRWYGSLSARDRDGIIVAGVISPETKRNLLAAADVLALPSRTESFGIVYLEAWANNKPVIAARAGAVPELVRHNENGLLVEYGDVSELSRALEMLLAHDADAKRLGENGRLLVERKFSWDAVKTRVFAAYSEVLGLQV